VRPTHLVQSGRRVSLLLESGPETGAWSAAPTRRTAVSRAIVGWSGAKVRAESRQ
jgi:hypothetical protein